MSLMATPINGDLGDKPTGASGNGPELRENRKATVRILIADDHPIVRDGLEEAAAAGGRFRDRGRGRRRARGAGQGPGAGPGRAAAGSAHAQSGRAVGASGAAADQQADPRDRADGFGGQERIRAGDEAGLQRHRAEADRAGPDRQEHPQGPLGRNLAGFAHHRGGDAPVLDRPGRLGRQPAAARAASAARYPRASGKSSRWWRRATRTKRWPRRCSSASRR